MATLGVNIDHIATLRQARLTKYPDLLAAALIAEASDADQVTVHLREDRRHIQDHDLWTLKSNIKTLLNLEMAASDEIVSIALEVRPDVCTFVPEKRQELTTEGGLDVAKNLYNLISYAKRLKEKHIVVSMFIEPEISQIDASKEALADSVEFHTGKFCGIYPDSRGLASELDRIKKAVAHARKLGLRPIAGHGLNYENAPLIVKEIPEIEEYNIGHAIISRAVFVGLSQAVREMKKIVA